MPSSNGNICRVTGPLCVEFTDPGEFPAQRPVTRNFDAFFDLRPNKRLSKQRWGCWFDTSSIPLWRHCNATAHPSVTWRRLLKIWQPLLSPHFANKWNSYLWKKVIKHNEFIIYTIWKDALTRGQSISHDSLVMVTMEWSDRVKWDEKYVIVIGKFVVMYSWRSI